MKKKLEKFKKFVMHELFIGLLTDKVNKKLDFKKYCLEHSTVDINKFILIKEVDKYIEQLKNELNEQKDIKKHIENKGKVLFLAITLFFIAIILLTIFLNSINNLSLFFLIVSILYLYRAFRKNISVINANEFYFIQSDIDVFEKKYEIKLRLNKEENNFLSDLVTIIEKNKKMLMILANNLTAAIFLLRNSIISLLVFILLNI
jgi:Ca2+/Na+ antiporter